MTGHSAGDLTSFSPSSLMTRLGISVTSVTPERVEGTMPVEGNTQLYGILHGGATAALAETLGSLGAMAHGGESRIAVGVDLNITHHRPASGGLVSGIATAIYLGRTVATYGVQVADSDGATIATARLTCAIRPRPGT